MSITEIHQQYPNNELTSLPGNQELRHELFAPLLNSLFIVRTANQKSENNQL